MSDLITLTWDSAPVATRDQWHQVARERMSDVHANRQREWALARMCLALCFEKHGIALNPTQAVFKNHHEVAHLPAWRFSLTHSREVAGAWLMPAAQVRGLGVDVELSNRKVPPQVKARLAHKQDIQLNDLELWTLKEAAFKALPTLAQTDIWLNRIIIREKQFELENSPFVGEWSLEKDQSLTIARAWLRP